MILYVPRKKRQPLRIHVARLHGGRYLLADASEWRAVQQVSGEVMNKAHR